MKLANDRAAPCPCHCGCALCDRNKRDHQASRKPTHRDRANYMPVNAKDNTAADDATEPNADETSSAASKSYGLLSIMTDTSVVFRIGILSEICLTLVFCGFTLYALIQGNTDAVRAACPKLWEFMVARSIAAIVVIIGLVLVYLYYWNAISDNIESNTNPDWAKVDQQTPAATQPVMYMGWVALLIYFATFFAVGIAIIPSNVPNSNLCVDTLSITVVTGTPILGITAWITCALDGIITLGLGTFLIYVLRISRT